MNSTSQATSQPSRAWDLTDLCTVLGQWSNWSWDKLLADTEVGFPPAEDQLTQELLSTVGHRFGHLTALWNQKRYSNRSEGGPTKPNADWEWWVGDGAGWNGIRVQAKKMDPSSGLYPDLDNDLTKKRQQATWLIANALKASGRPVPAYCFFNAWADPAPVTSHLGTSPWRRLFGASLVPAPDVLSAIVQRQGDPSKKVGFDSVIQRPGAGHLPLHRLFCSDGTHSRRESLVAWSSRHIELYEIPDNRLPPGSPASEPVGPESLPDHAKALLRTLSSDPTDRLAAQEYLDGIDEPSDPAVVVTVEDRGVVTEALTRIDV